MSDIPVGFIHYLKSAYIYSGSALQQQLLNSASDPVVQLALLNSAQDKLSNTINLFFWSKYYINGTQSVPAGGQ